MIISERKRRDTGSKKLGKNSYPRASFQYLSYDTDAKPDILVLGTWKNPATKNNLIAGVNLNYLSSGQLVKLRKAAKRIFNRDTVRSRYRYLKQILPDVAMFYRTYDTKYIKSIEHNELDSYSPAKTSPKDEKTKTTADIDKAAHTTERPKDTDERTDELDREAWRMKRRLYEPEKQRRRTSPERIGIAGSKAAKKAKATRYVRDRRKLKELERQVALAKELRKMDELEPEEPEEIEEPEDDYGPEYHLDDLGYEGYIRNHQPDAFRLLTESNGSKLLAIYDIVSKQFIIDSVASHAEMLFDAGWDYDHTVLFEITGDELIVIFDCSEEDARVAVSNFKKSDTKRLLFESRCGV
jgi:hypothetical protein